MPRGIETSIGSKDDFPVELYGIVIAYDGSFLNW